MTGVQAGQLFATGRGAGRIARWVAGASRANPRWWRRLLAVGLGVAATAALPPVHALPLLIPAFAGLIWLIDSAPTKKAAFGAGWWFGFGHFASGLYWLALPLLLDPLRFGWMIPFAIFGVGGVLAAFVGLASLATALTRFSGPGRILVFAVAWAAMEWLRGHVLTGFPWNLAATAWTVSPEMMQFAAVAGAYGLSLVTVLIAAMPAVLADPAPAQGWRRHGGALWTAAAGILLAAVWAGGYLRIPAGPAPQWPNVRLRLVQGNVEQKLKWRSAMVAQHLQKYLRLSRSAGADRITHVVWPETATMYWLSLNPQARRLIGDVAPPGGAVLTGAVRVNAGRNTFWNSVHAIDRAGRIVANYDKHHLVPFGEYVPFRSVLNIAKITYGRVDFTPGPGPRTLRAAGLPAFSPLICYEAIFPGAVADRADPPKWLLNVTNDGWFGTSSGPYQHFASSLLRAVEEGLPLVRVANTGISAVADGYGRVIKRLGLNRTGFVDSGLPRPIPGLTLYRRFGDWTLVLLMAAVGGLAFAGRRR